MNKEKLKLLTIALCLMSAEASANVAECILKNMPEVSNEPARAAVFRQCHTEYPNGMYEIKRGSGLGLFSYKNREECVIDKAKKTPHSGAAMNINAACNCLYIKPSFKGEMCAYKKQKIDWSQFTPIK